MAERLTLEDAITHAKEVAERNRKQYKNCPSDRTDIKHQTCEECAEEHEQLAIWLAELKRYKDLEEQGRLIELPCAVGDTVYLLSYDIIHPFTINGFEINKYEVEFKGSYCGEDKNLEHWEIRLPVSNICKTVLLTPEEAEAKLKELRGEQE